MRTIGTLLLSLLLVACDPSWQLRNVPTTEEESEAVTLHVETILIDAFPEQLDGDDQDLEDLIEAAHREARNSICRPTLWEITSSHEYTGRWKYVEEVKP